MAAGLEWYRYNTVNILDHNRITYTIDFSGGMLHVIHSIVASGSML